MDSAVIAGDHQFFSNCRGGVLIFIIAISMLQARGSRTRSTPQEEHERHEGEDIAIFPLAIPMMSGPVRLLR